MVYKSLTLEFYQSIMSVTRILYRSMMRFADKVTKNDKKFRVRLQPRVEQWAFGAYTRKSQRHFIQQIFPTLQTSVPEDADALSRDQLKSIIRAEFKLHSSVTDPAKAREMIDSAFESLRHLGTLTNILKCTSVAITRGVQVEVTSQYLPNQSMPERNYYLFTYRVRVSNIGKDTIKLHAREWTIANAHGHVVGEVPRGSPGVVGHTPVLAPGQIFEYASGTDLNTPNGVMWGSFQMKDCAGGEEEEDNITWTGNPLAKDEFDAEVAKFRLVSDFDALEENDPMLLEFDHQ